MESELRKGKRFDLEKWFADNHIIPYKGLIAVQTAKDAVAAAENHQRELMEAELSRVRQQARAEATEQCATKEEIKRVRFFWLTWGPRP